jgi:succinate dehydrogenase / fumarate reductase, membrane anchor subunit
MKTSRNAMSWYLQRITGAALVPLLVAHFWVEHYMTASLLRGDLSYQVILTRIANPWWRAIDISFLLIALYHGLNGLFGIVLDFEWIGLRAARTIAIALTVVGLAWAYWGIQAFRNL